MTPMGSRWEPLIRGGLPYCLSRLSEEAISIIWASPTPFVSVFEIQYTAFLVFHATSRRRAPS